MLRVCGVRGCVHEGPLPLPARLRDDGQCVEDKGFSRSSEPDCTLMTAATGDVSPKGIPRAAKPVTTTGASRMSLAIWLIDRAASSISGSQWQLVGVWLKFGMPRRKVVLFDRTARLGKDRSHCSCFGCQCPSGGGGGSRDRPPSWLDAVCLVRLKVIHLETWAILMRHILLEGWEMFNEH